MARPYFSIRAEIITAHSNFTLVGYTTLFTYLNSSASSDFGRKIIGIAEFIHARAGNRDVCVHINKTTSVSFMLTMERQLYNRPATQTTITLPLSVGF